MIRAELQPNLPSRSGKKVDLIGFAIFHTGGHLGF